MSLLTVDLWKLTQVQRLLVTHQGISCGNAEDFYLVTSHGFPELVILIRGHEKKV